jgi:DNA topoisomerase-3
VKVFIAEKPSMAMDIARALGSFRRANGYFETDKGCVTFCIGHLLGQAPPEAYDAGLAKDKPWTFDTLPIVPAVWQHEVNPKTREQLAVIAALLKRATIVIHAGDAGREGQLIVDELLQHCGFRGRVERLWLQSMTPDAIRKALGKMKDNREHAGLSAAATARARADWLTGMNLTRAFSIPWKRGGNGGALHIGRVKTPTLCFVVERELAIRNFQPKDYYVVRTTVAHPNGTFVATWEPTKEAEFLDAEGRIEKRMVAEAMATWFAGMPAEIHVFEKTAKSVPPPLPFSLGDLQKTANRLLGLSPSETLDVAQALYEKHKLTSYPRTDSNHLPEEEHKHAQTLVEATRSNFGNVWPFKGTPDFSLKSPAWNSAKISDHHAIRPTETRDYDLAKLSAAELAVYRLVVRNFLAQFYPYYRYDATRVSVDCNGEKLVASGQQPTDAGWRVLFGMDEDEAPAGDPPLPPMAAGDLVAIADAAVDTRTTTPPARFTGATLIDAMERAHLFVGDAALKATLKGAGIGTPATRAAIVDELVTQGYLTSQKKHYHPTDRAMACYQVIPPTLRKPDSTALIEDTLRQIEKGEASAEAFLAQHVADITALVETAKTLQPPDFGLGERKSQRAGKTGPPCPECGKPMIQRTSARGPFLGCSGYPTCKHTQNLEPRIAGKTPPRPGRRGA